MNAFAYITKQKGRFGATRYTIEDLWELPLESDTRSSLKGVSEEILAEKAELPRPNLVSDISVSCEGIDAKIEVLRYIIKAKKAEEKAKQKAKDNKEIEATLVKAIAESQTKDLIGDKSTADLKKALKQVRNRGSN